MEQAEEAADTVRWVILPDMFGEGDVQDLSATLLDDLIYSSLTWWSNEDTMLAASTIDSLRLFVHHSCKSRRSSDSSVIPPPASVVELGFVFQSSFIFSLRCGESASSLPCTVLPRRHAKS